MSVLRVWIMHLLSELHFPISTPVTLYCDNLSTTYMAFNPVFHACTKHIELDYHSFANVYYLVVIVFNLFPPPTKLQICSLRGFTSIAMSFCVPNSSSLDR